MKLMVNGSSISFFSIINVFRNIEDAVNSDVEYMHVVISNSTYYVNQINSSIGVTTNQVPKSYIPSLKIVYVIYSIFLIFILIQLLSIVHSAYGFTKGRTIGPAAVDPLPRISVIIPIKNEPIDAVVEVIKGLLNVDYPPLNLLEVIIVSDDDEAYVKELNNALGLTLKGINLDYRVIRRDRPVGYKGGAVNYAASLATGDVITILDVDTKLPREYFRRALDYLAAGYDVVGAPPFLGLPKVSTKFSRALTILFNVLAMVQVVGRAMIRTRRGFYMLIGNNLTMLKSTFMKYGGLCHCKADDIDLAIRVLLSRGRIGLMDVYAVTEVPSTYYAFRSQTIRWATNDIWALRKYARRALSMGFLNYIDLMLWLIKYPTAYIGLALMVLSLFMQLIGVLIPPLPVLILMIASDILGLVMIIQLLDIGRRLGYNILDTFKALIVGGLTVYALTYPLVFYLTKSAISDIPWMRTPKASRA